MQLARPAAEDGRDAPKTTTQRPATTTPRPMLRGSARSAGSTNIWG